MAVRRSASLHNSGARSPPFTQIHSGTFPRFKTSYVNVTLCWFYSCNCSLQVFPPQPIKLDYSFFNREKVSRSLVPKQSKPCPAYIAPITGTGFIFEMMFIYLKNTPHLASEQSVELLLQSSVIWRGVGNGLTSASPSDTSKPPSTSALESY